MNAKNKAGALAQSLRDEAAKNAAAAETAAARTLAVAEAWDASGFAGLQPWNVCGRKGIYGDEAALSFRDAGPDDLVQLMTAFPAVPCVTYSHNRTRYFHPEGARTVPEGVDVRTCDGFEVQVSGSCFPGGGSYDKLCASWSAIVGGLQTRFTVDLRRVAFLHPRTSRRAVNNPAFGFIRFEGPASLNWPKDMQDAWETLKIDADLTAFSYYAGDTGSGDFHIRGGDVLALAKAWEDKANERGEQTKKAFLSAYAICDYGKGFPSVADIAAFAETTRDTYDRERKGLRAGTLQQTAALTHPYALVDRTVAEKHWPEYVAHHGIESTQSYFDHYAWACAYLQRVGLYEVPVTDEMREQATGGINGDTYKYGHRWL